MSNEMSTQDYRMSMGLPDENATDNVLRLHYQWEDKKHRHVYDLCDEIDRLHARIAELEKELDEAVALAFSEHENEIRAFDAAKAAESCANAIQARDAESVIAALGGSK